MLVGPAAAAQAQAQIHPVALPPMQTTASGAAGNVAQGPSSSNDVDEESDDETMDDNEEESNDETMDESED